MSLAHCAIRTRSYQTTVHSLRTCMISVKFKKGTYDKCIVVYPVCIHIQLIMQSIKHDNVRTFYTIACGIQKWMCMYFLPPTGANTALTLRQLALCGGGI